jgi:hypothetical protein
MTAALGVLAFGAALLGEGDFEIIKHLYLFDVVTGLLAVFVVVGLVAAPPPLLSRLRPGTAAERRDRRRHGAAAHRASDRKAEPVAVSRSEPVDDRDSGQELA